MKPLIILAIETAMRRGEMLDLQWQHVDLVRCVAHLPLTKNGDSRDIPLSRRAVATLREAKQTAKCIVEALTGAGLQVVPISKNWVGQQTQGFGMADQSAMRRWILTHLTRLWTALFTLAGLGAAFVYKPEWVTLYLRTTMTAIETGAAALPYPWGDRLEVILRGIGGSVWMQFAFAIVVVRVAVWLIARFIGYCWRRGAR
jgi:integrase